MFSVCKLDQGYKPYKLPGPNEMAVPPLQALDETEAGGAVLVIAGLVRAGEPPTPEDLLRDADDSTGGSE